MRTITLIAWRRPAYTQQVLEALGRCREREKWRLLIYVDGGAPESIDVLKTCARHANQSPHSAFVDIRYNDHPPLDDLHVGATNAARCAFEWAYEELASPFNLAIEDDTLLSPDALELCNWYASWEQRHDYLHLSVASIQPDYIRPLDIVETDGVRSPWCLAMLPHGWEFLRSHWDTKKRHPMGWDWSLSYAMCKADVWGLHPYLGRALNIGRENGVHTQVQLWDETIGRMVASDGSHGKDYRFAGKWDRRIWSGAGRMAYEWMRAEMEAERGR